MNKHKKSVWSNCEYVFDSFSFINNPGIAEQFAHPTVPHSYREGFEDALKSFQLKKFLLLVYFLDKAKCARLMDYNPCLFNKNAEFKVS